MRRRRRAGHSSILASRAGGLSLPLPLFRVLSLPTLPAISLFQLPCPPPPPHTHAHTHLTERYPTFVGRPPAATSRLLIPRVLPPIRASISSHPLLFFASYITPFAWLPSFFSALINSLPPSLSLTLSPPYKELRMSYSFPLKIRIDRWEISDDRWELR
jgi:hypothetical protein